MRSRFLFVALIALAIALSIAAFMKWRSPDGDRPLWPGSVVVTTPEEAERELLAQKEAGYDGMEIMTNLLPEVYEAILDASEEHDFPVYGHVSTRVGLRKDAGAVSQARGKIWMLNRY